MLFVLYHLMRALIPKSKTKGKQKKQYLKLIQLVSAHPEINKTNAQGIPSASAGLPS
jgi:hypothetical protein